MSVSLCGASDVTAACGRTTSTQMIKHGASNTTVRGSIPR